MADNLLYEAIEKAAMSDQALWPDFAKAGPVHTTMISPTKFVVEDVYWRDEAGNIYQPVIEAQYRGNIRVAALYVVGNITLDWFSSGDTKMFRPETRYRTFI